MSLISISTRDRYFDGPTINVYESLAELAFAVSMQLRHVMQLHACDDATVVIRFKKQASGALARLIEFHSSRKREAPTEIF